MVSSDTTIGGVSPRRLSAVHNLAKAIPGRVAPPVPVVQPIASPECVGLLVGDLEGDENAHRDGEPQPGPSRVATSFARTPCHDDDGSAWSWSPLFVLALVPAVIALVGAFGLSLAPIDRSDPRCHGGDPRPHHPQPGGPGVRDGYPRGSLPRMPTARQVDVLAAFVATCGCWRMRRRVSASGRARRSDTSPTCGRVGPQHKAADLPRAGRAWLVAPNFETHRRAGG